MSVRHCVGALVVAAGTALVVSAAAPAAGASPITDILGALGSGSTAPGTAAPSHDKIATLVNGPLRDYTVSGFYVPGGGQRCLATPRLGTNTPVPKDSRVQFLVTRVIGSGCVGQAATIVVYLASASGATIALSYTVDFRGNYTGGCERTTGGATCELKRTDPNATVATLT